ncbi:OB-fold nucleic acid binding domain-containing protein [Ruegeria sp. WL0004]|uniref:Error-prone DNA polymerase n=1 Tax=Ruegeria marisflavi TaxID=2984152 RepID=A0ABT2WWF0_9RHOB|nr:OB-fold nucleic acid binding domain-containing protein [Ruegeria sp. WL0004]MCU9839993.1 OB-fold nucleic acid binding domain-containing protein [Ruegeria sp. WL0004]
MLTNPQSVPKSDQRPDPLPGRRAGSAPRRSGPAWPRPPACLRACDLGLPPEGARVAVAGLVILRQRPGTAKGVIFVTLEDETGVVNVIVWRKIYERFRRAVIAGRMLRVTGRMQRAHSVTHVIAEEIEDISALLDLLVRPEEPAGFAPEGKMR